MTDALKHVTPLLSQIERERQEERIESDYPGGRKELPDAYICVEHSHVACPDCVRAFRESETIYEQRIALACGGAEQAKRGRDALSAALDTITRLGGNLDDDRHTDKTGPNDARQRGLMYCAAREIARKALEANDPTWKPALEWKQELK